MWIIDREQGKWQLIVESEFLQYDFEGRKDLVKFVKLVGEAGLLAHLRIGPYVCAEWNYGYEFSSFFQENSIFFIIYLLKLECHICITKYVLFLFMNSGFPLWLHFIPGIKLRTDNEPFKVTALAFSFFHFVLILAVIVM